MSTPGPITLVLDDGKGGQETHTFEEPGGELRFTVGDRNHHAGTWKVWATKTNSSVYATIRVLGGLLKISLHDGPKGADWRVQWGPQFMEAHPEVGNRIIERLERPDEVGETGWTKGISIWVRHQDVVAAPAGESPWPADMVLLPTPPKGHAIGVHIVFARPTNQFVSPGGLPFGGLMLADGQVVLLVASQSAVTNETNRAVDSTIRELTRSVEIEFDDSGDFRSLVRTDAADGDPQFWDVAVRPDSVGEAD